MLFCKTWTEPWSAECEHLINLSLFASSKLLRVNRGVEVNNFDRKALSVLEFSEVF